MTYEPLVTICTPVFNGQAFLEHCIKSVLNQTYKHFEYVIVDNASTDRTPEIIEKYRSMDSRIKVFRNDSTLNIIDNFNKCAEHSSENSQWLKYALADDYLFPNCVEEMVNTGMLDDQIALVSAYRIYGTRTSNLGLPLEEKVFDGAEILRKQLLRQLHVCSSSPNTVMYRRAPFMEVGGFDNTYLHADTELAFRLLDRYKLGFVHYFLTSTGLHKGRGEAFSLREGIVLREYLQFGFKQLDRYKSVSFDAREKDALADYYSEKVLDFLVPKFAYFDFRSISGMLEVLPAEVKGKLTRSLFRRFPRYLKSYLSALVHVGRYMREKPTFKNIRGK